ncbi:MAG: gliding motility protein GldN [Tannerella sp.]|jgi:gliding motility associated protien GldN|nr:gliding motility protein GldN [Tannerella sp.]
MRRFFYITLLFIGLFASIEAQNNPQTPRVSRGADRARQQQTQQNSGLPELSVRAQIMNEQLTQNTDKARWMRIIYREIDLTKEKNSPLYYPVREVNGQMNLFTKLFNLVSEGKVKVYKYTGDSESFEDDNILSYRDMLEKFDIYFDSIPAGGNRPAAYVVNSSDIPSSEVRTYYIKEAWYFDQNNSLYDVKTLALCPIAYIISDMGEQPTPMFWTKYEDIRPYIKNSLIMTSNINNAKTYTYDDYFRKRMFDGEIFQTENMLNLPLMQIYPTPDSLQIAQQQIEKQLISFNDSLWVPQDTTLVLSKKEQKKVGRSTPKADKTESGVTTDNKTTVKQKKEAAPKPAKSSSASKSSPTRSIRRR